MKKALLITLALFLASCSCSNKESEDFDPYPGGKAPKENPQVKK